MVKKNSTVNTRGINTEDHSRHWVLRLLDLTLDFARVYLYTLCWELCSSVFQVFINNVYLSATPGKVNHLQPVAAQQDAS